MSIFDIVIAMKVPGRITRKQWKKLPENIKRAYVKLHPTSIFAELYKKEKLKESRKNKSLPSKNRMENNKNSVLKYKPSTFKPLKRITLLDDDILVKPYKEYSIPSQYIPKRSSKIIENKMSNNQTRLALEIFRDLYNSNMKFKGDENISKFLKNKYGRRWTNIEKAYKKLEEDNNSFLYSGIFMYEQPEDIEQNHIKWVIEHFPWKAYRIENMCVENQINLIKNNPEKAPLIKNISKKAFKLLQDMKKEIPNSTLVKPTQTKEIPNKTKEIPNKIVQNPIPSPIKENIKENTVKKPFVGVLDKVKLPQVEKISSPVIVDNRDRSLINILNSKTGKTAKINIDVSNKNPEIVKEMYKLLGLRHLAAGNYVHYKDLIPEHWEEILNKNPNYLVLVKEAPSSLIYKIAKNDKDLINALPQEYKEKLVNEDGMLLRYIKDATSNIMDAALDSNGAAIQFIKNPSEEQQERAVRSNLFSFRYINNPSDTVKDMYESLMEDYKQQKKEGKSFSDMYKISL